MSRRNEVLATLPEEELHRLFDGRVARSRTPDGCWLWTGFLNEDGYGEVCIPGSNVILAAHRISYRLHHGDVPDGLDVCHTCDTPRCVAPHHLFSAPSAINRADCVEKERHVRGENHADAKLAAQDVLAIRRSYARAEATQAEIGRRYGVRQSTIGRIVRGLIWSHVGGPRTYRGKGFRRESVA